MQVLAGRLVQAVRLNRKEKSEPKYKADTEGQDRNSSNFDKARGRRSWLPLKQFLAVSNPQAELNDRPGLCKSHHSIQNRGQQERQYLDLVNDQAEPYSPIKP